MNRRNNSGRGAAAADLLHHEGVGQFVAALAAVLLGIGHAQHTELLQLFDGLERKALFLVYFGGDGGELGLSELAKHLPGKLMLLAQFEIHVAFSSLLGVRSYFGPVNPKSQESI
ncbi:hypothetical protein SDC9_150662 [bioreactor metagenome]|uniref:Uncharacterized protein n=1 Tax=bioreactor metagenome TaxID=1076179 RepID=A0A645EQ86_9ZZZZ